jgi:hypothetical protein
MDILPLSIRKRTITATDLYIIQKVIDENRNRSRTEISKVLCRKWNLRQPNGRLKDMACREILLKLHRNHLMDYPAGFHDGRNKELNKSITSADIDTTLIAHPLSQLDPPRLILVRGGLYEPLYRSLVKQYHDLRYWQIVGNHLNPFLSFFGLKNEKKSFFYAQ